MKNKKIDHNHQQPFLMHPRDYDKFIDDIQYAHDGGGSSSEW